MKPDLLFLAHKRPDFTLCSFAALCMNTPHQAIRRLYIFTDGERLPFNPDPFWDGDIRVDTALLGGPVAVMNAYLDLTEEESPMDEPPPPWFIKVDNDLVLPPNWFERSRDVVDANAVDLLGIEPWCPELDKLLDPMHPATLNYFKPNGWLRAETREGRGLVENRHIGGIGWMRRRAFDLYGRPQPARGGRFGFTEWQWQNPDVRKAFMRPSLPCCLLDHVPASPWPEFSARYVAEGVQRQPWGTYKPEHAHLWNWWIQSQLAAGEETKVQS